MPQVMPKISKCLFKHTYNSIELQEKNNRVGKTRNLFKQMGDIKGTFHARMGMIKDRNGMALTEAEEIKKRWQECTKALNKERSY